MPGVYGMRVMSAEEAERDRERTNARMALRRDADIVIQYLLPLPLHQRRTTLEQIRSVNESLWTEVRYLLAARMEANESLEATQEDWARRRQEMEEALERARTARYPIHRDLSALRNYDYDIRDVLLNPSSRMVPVPELDPPIVVKYEDDKPIAKKKKKFKIIEDTRVIDLGD